jgi:hypothetical protein
VGTIWANRFISNERCRRKPLTSEELEKVIRESYFEKEQRVIKADGKFKFEGK